MPAISIVVVDNLFAVAEPFFAVGVACVLGVIVVTAIVLIDVPVVVDFDAAVLLYLVVFVPS